jgi:predicted metalloendopeptidase
LKAYLNGVVHGATSLNTALENENFNFYSTTFRGTEKQRPLWRRGVETVNKTLAIVGKVYVEKQKLKKVSILVKNLIKAYEESYKTRLDES